VWSGYGDESSHLLNLAVQKNRDLTPDIGGRISRARQKRVLQYNHEPTVSLAVCCPLATGSTVTSCCCGFC
jgi:hypothetical protein